MGISLFTDETKTTYKSTYQLLKDISEIYDELTDKQQAELLEKLAGKRGAQTLAGLLKDFSPVEKAMQTMENAAGSADREMEIIKDSIDYKLNYLKQTWIGIAQDLINRDDIGSIINSISNLSSVIDNLIVKREGLLGVSAAIGSISGALLGIKGSGLLNIVQNPNNNSPFNLGLSHFTLVNPLLGKRNTNDLNIFNQFISSWKQGEININNYKQALEGMSETNRIWVNGLVTQSDKFRQVNPQIALATTSSTELSKAFQRQAISARSLAIAQTALNTVLNIGIGLVVGVLINAFSRLATAQSDAAKRISEATNDFKQSKSNIEEYKQKIIELQEKLSDDSLSYEESKAAREELLKVQSDLLDNYGTEADKINLITKAIKGEIGALDELSKKEWEKAKHEANNTTVFEDVSGFISGEGSGLERINSAYSNPYDFFTRTTFLGSQNGKPQVEKEVFDQAGILESDDIETVIKKLDDYSKKLEDVNGKATTASKNIAKWSAKISEFYNQTNPTRELELKYDIIPEDKKLQKSIDELNSLYDEYNEHKVDNDEHAAELSKKAYIKAFNETKEYLKKESSDPDLFRYVDNLHPELTVESNEDNLAEALKKQVSWTSKEKKEVENTAKEATDDVNTYFKTLEPIKPKVEVDPDVVFNKTLLYSKLQNLSSGGNVDLTNRTKIPTSKLSDVGWEDVGEGYATTFTSTYSNEDGTLAINVTPILPNGDVMTPDELQEYAEGILAGTNEDYLQLQIGSIFNGEDAIQQASDAAEEAHELQEQYYIENPVKAEADLDFSDKPAEVEVEVSNSGTLLDEIKSIVEQSGFTTQDDFLTIAGNENSDKHEYYQKIRDLLDKNGFDETVISMERFLELYGEAIGLISDDTKMATEKLDLALSKYKVSAAGVSDEEMAASQSDSYKELLNITKDLNNEQKFTFVEVIENAKTADEAIQLWKEHLKELNEELEKTNLDFISNLNTKVPDLDLLQKIYTDVQDKGTFDFSALTSDDMKEKFGEYEAEYSRFVETITSHPDDINATQSAFNDLVDAWIRGSGILDDLTEDNKIYAIKELQEAGVENAEDVVNSYLAEEEAAKKLKEQLKALAPEVAKYKDSLAKLAKKKSSSDKTGIVLNEKEVKEYNKAIQKTQTYLGRLLNMDVSEKMTEEFAQSASNLDDLEAALNGSAEAIARVRAQIANGLIMDIGVDIDTEQASNVVNAFAEYITSIDPKIIGTAEFDTSQAVYDLNMLLATTGATAEKIEQIYGALGVDATVTGFKTIKVPDLSTKREEIFNGITSTRYDYKEIQFPTIEYKPKGNSGSNFKFNTGNTGSSGSGGSGGGGGGGGSSSSDPTKTPFDWIERKIKIVTDKISQLQGIVSDTWESWTKRSSKLNTAIDKTRKLITLNTKAAKDYKKAADRVAKGYYGETVNGKVKKNSDWSGSLSKSWIKKVQNGSVGKNDLQMLIEKGKKSTADQIQAYMDWWDKYKAALDATVEAQRQLREEFVQQRELIQSEYESKHEVSESKLGISTATYEGEDLKGIASNSAIATYYYAIKKADKENLKLLKKERNKLNKQLEKEDEEQKKLLKDQAKKYSIEEAEKQAQKELDKKYGKKNRDTKKYKKAYNKRYKELQKELYNNKYKKLWEGWLSDEERNSLVSIINETDAAITEQTNDTYQHMVDHYQRLIDRITEIYENTTITPKFNIDLSNEYSSLVESQGRLLDDSFYRFQQENIQAQINATQKTKKELEGKLEKAFKAGLTLDNETVREWWTQWQDISKEEITQMTQMQEAQNAIYENEKKRYDLLQDRISLLSTETDFYRNILSANHELYDLGSGSYDDFGTGRFTEYGNAALATYAMDYEFAKQQRDQAIARRSAIMSDATRDKNSLKYKQDLDEINAQIREYITNMNNAKKANLDMYKNQYQEMLKVLKKYIDRRKQQLSIEKDLYDYQKKIRDASQNVNVLKKQLTVLNGDTSEENRARIQKLQVQLKEAEENLQDSEYERWLSDTQGLMDEMYQEFSDMYDQLVRQINIDARMKETVDALNTNANSIVTTLNTELGYVGGNMSDDMSSILTNSFKISSMDGTLTSLSNYIMNTMKTDINKVIADNMNILNNIVKENADIQKDGGLTTQNKVGESKRVVQIAGTGQTFHVDSKNQNEALKIEENWKWLKSVIGMAMPDYNKARSYYDSRTANTQLNNKLYKDEKAFNKFMASIAKGWGTSTGFDPYHDQYRQKIYKAMNLKGAWNNDDKSRKYILQQLAGHGFATGGLVSGEFRKLTGEDGIALVRKGEYILTPNMLKDALSIVNPLAKLAENNLNIKSVPTNIDIGNTTFNVTLPNVTNYEEFKKELIADKQFEKVIRQTTLGSALGNNSLKKYSIR